MLRFSDSSRAIYGLCRSLSNQIGKRHQSTGTPKNIAVEPNTSQMSIFSGHIKGAITNNLEFIRPETLTPIPIYQVLDPDGKIKDESQTPDVRRDRSGVGRPCSLSLVYRWTLDQNVSRYDAAQCLGSYSVRISTTRSYLILHDELRWRSHAYRQCRRAQSKGSRLRAVSRSRYEANWPFATDRPHLSLKVSSCTVVSSCKSSSINVSATRDRHAKGFKCQYITGRPISASSPLATQMPQAVGSAYAYKRSVIPIALSLCILSTFLQSSKWSVRDLLLWWRCSERRWCPCCSEFCSNTRSTSSLLLVSHCHVTASCHHLHSSAQSKQWLCYFHHYRGSVPRWWYC